MAQNKKIEPAKITTDRNEQSVAGIFEHNTKVFNIPYFQRQFEWDGHKLNPLWEDLIGILNEPEDSHFLGVIITLKREASGEFNNFTVYDIIDGQQRITTLYLMLLAVVEHWLERGEIKQAVTIYENFIAKKFDKDAGLETNLTICLSEMDRPQIAQIFKKIFKRYESFASDIGEDYKPVFAQPEEEPDGAKNTKLINMWELIRKKISKLNDSGHTVKEFSKILTSNSRLVMLVTEDPRQGPKIFERWNSRGEKISITDLVRNQIFSLADDPENLKKAHDLQWKPFTKVFPQNDNGKTLENFFFPYALIKNPSISKSRLFQDLRQVYWKDKDAKWILNDLGKYKFHYLTLSTGTNLVKLKPNTFKALQSLLHSGISTMTYPFLMQLLEKVIKNKQEPEAAKIFGVIESYFVRRSILHLDAAGLKAVFLNLWPKVKNQVTSERVSEVLRGQRLEKWPTDKEVKKAVQSEPLANSKIIWFLLENLEIGLYKAKRWEASEDIRSKEHILPEQPDAKSEWWELFPTDTHRARVDTLPNIIPLHKSDNSEINNKGYVDVKRKKYNNQKTFSTPQSIASNFKEWNPESMDKRAEQLSNWIVNRWKR